MNSRTGSDQLPLFGADVAASRDPQLETVSRFRLELVAEKATAYSPDVRMDRPEAAAEWMSGQIASRPQEHMIAAYLNTRQKLIGWSVIAIGTINRASVEPRAILQVGLALNAAGFILSHNHPSGDPTPSAEDLAFTRRASEAGDIVGVRLIDHLIVGDGGRWVSLRRRGAI